MYSAVGRRWGSLEKKAGLSLLKGVLGDFLRGNRRFPCLYSANTCKFACKITKKY